jgi:hypothetical protein
MKTKACIIAILLAGGLTSIRAQDTWTQKADFGGTARFGAVGFSIGSKGYVGTGSAFNSGHKIDFWEYDPSTNAWTQKANFGGPGRDLAVGFSIGSKGYIGTGSTDVGFVNDFWEYDPATNTWTQKADFGGTGRSAAAGFSIASKGYVGTGYNGSYLKDFWEYDPATNTWAQKADFGGTIRSVAVGFFIGSKGYIGTGDFFDGSWHYYNDFWEYDPATNTWTQKASFGGPGRGQATGFSSGSKGYIGTGVEYGNNIFYKDFWEYDPATNTWAQKADFGGTIRAWAVGFFIGSKGYLGTGYNSSSFYKNFWEYTPDNLPIVMLSTTDLTFGAQLVGTRSAAQLVTLTNGGPVTLTISSITASGDFLQKNNCGSSLAPGESCTIKVAFRPSEKGDRTGSVTITDNAGDSPQMIALTGIGTVVQLSPSALNFGNQIVGTTSDPLTATVTNIGSEDLHIFGVGLGGANFGDFAETTTCGSRLAAGGSCTIDVTFTPGARGHRHASLKIVDDGGASPQTVPLAGTGVPR